MSVKLPSEYSAHSDSPTLAYDTMPIVVMDLTLSHNSLSAHPSGASNLPRWRQIMKDLHLHSTSTGLYLHVAEKEVDKLTENDQVVLDIRISDDVPDTCPNTLWESRSGGIWVLKGRYNGDSNQAVTAVDVLFGADAVDPRPKWTLLQSFLRLGTRPDVPVSRLSIRHGRVIPSIDRPRLQVHEDGTFKILQISDTHMVTGGGVCRDAMDAQNQPLPICEADSLTVKFMSSVLDIENPDLVILSGDQLHHDILDSQSALFKVVAPMVERSIPYALVFGNHDDEGTHALSREAQMSILQTLPFSLCEFGPKNVTGIGNYYLQVLGRPPFEIPLMTLFFLDSHGSLSQEQPSLGYKAISESQIRWFTNTSQSLRKEREKQDEGSKNIALAFQHIPLPEYGYDELRVQGGHRGEQTEGPKLNSGFYHALAKEGVVAMGCGHDHVNDFCGLLPQQKPRVRSSQENAASHSGNNLWLCYGGSCGFGGYGSYGGKRYHRRVRIWEFEAGGRLLRTWKRVEYIQEKFDELLLLRDGDLVIPSTYED